MCRLGLKNHLVARSHECDYPPDVKKIPACTSPRYQRPDQLSSSEIHRSVTTILEQSLSVYEVDSALLKEARPDVVLTQDHCEVCAVSMSELQKSVRGLLDDDTAIVSVSPSNLEGVLQSFRTVADALGVSEKGGQLAEDVTNRLHTLRDKTTPIQNKPSVVAIEWIDPLMTAGNWMPELIDAAGGQSQLADAGTHSPVLEWDRIADTNPDILLIVPCGYTINRTQKEMGTLTSQLGWETLSAVQNNQVYLLDGHHYFNRPGPRLADSAEILAEIFYPDIFPPHRQSSGWVSFTF